MPRVAGSILSVGSAGSLLSVGSAGSILSYRSSEAILHWNGERMSTGQVLAQVALVTATGVVAGFLSAAAGRQLRRWAS